MSTTRLKVLFLGRKPAASTALRLLYQQGCDICAVVAPLTEEVADDSLFWRPLLRDTALELKIPVVTDSTIYECLTSAEASRRTGIDLENIDVVISFLFWKRVLPPLIGAPRIGAFNFHPGPLPEFRGRRGYNFAILEGHKEYGATVHWLSEKFDEGDVVEVRRLPILPDDTAFSLEQRTQELLVEMFCDFVTMLQSGKSVPRSPQGPGKSATKAQMLAETRVRLDDPPELTARRVRAFWYPPHTGATLTIGGRDYTLVDSNTLKGLGRFLHGSKDKPF